MSVLLFINSPASGSDDAQTITGGTDPDIFTNITFSDALPGTPIQNGGAADGQLQPGPAAVPAHRPAEQRAVETS